jgi:hypothetical protein
LAAWRATKDWEGLLDVSLDDLPVHKITTLIPFEGLIMDDVTGAFKRDQLPEEYDFLLLTMCTAAGEVTRGLGDKSRLSEQKVADLYKAIGHFFEAATPAARAGAWAFLRRASARTRRGENEQLALQAVFETTAPATQNVNVSEQEDLVVGGSGTVEPLLVMDNLVGEDEVMSDGTLFGEEAIMSDGTLFGEEAIISDGCLFGEEEEEKKEEEKKEEEEEKKEEEKGEEKDKSQSQDLGNLQDWDPVLEAPDFPKPREEEEDWSMFLKFTEIKWLN